MTGKADNYLKLQLGPGGPVVQAAIDHNLILSRELERTGTTSGTTKTRTNWSLLHDQYFFDQLRRTGKA